MALVAIRPGPKDGLCATPSGNATESATQTFKLGAILINNAGRLEEAADGNVVNIVGVAEEEGANAAAGADVRYTPALPHITFEASLDDGDDEGNGVIAQVDLYEERGLQKNAATGKWFVDKTGAAKRVVITKLVDPVGTVQGKVQFKFMPETTVYSSPA